VKPAQSATITLTAGKQSTGSLGGGSTRGTLTSVCWPSQAICRDVDKKEYCLFGQVLHQKACLPFAGQVLACPVLPDQPLRHSSPNAAAIPDLLGDTSPFSVISTDPDTLLIYKTKPQKNSDLKIQDLQQRIALLLSATESTNFEIEVPHASGLSDLMTKISALNFPQFKTTAIGDGRIRITASTSSCQEFESFLKALKRIAWQPHPESPVDRLYNLDAATASNLLTTGKSGANAGESANTDTGDKTAPSDTSPDSSGDSTPQDNTTSNQGKTQKAAGGSKQSKGADSAPSSSSEDPASVAVANDLLVLTPAKPGDEVSIAEKKRILALLDLPRPEMIINAWVVQSSTKRPDKFGDVKRVLRETVNDHNDAMQRSIFTGWTYVKTAMLQQDYFDADFHDYLTLRVVLDNASYADPTQPVALETDLGRKLSLAAAQVEQSNIGTDVCPIGEYCLGYSTLFDPLSPRLTDLLLAVIAAKDPVKVINCAVNRMEGVIDSQDVIDHIDKHCAEISLPSHGHWAAARSVTVKAKRRKDSMRELDLATKVATESRLSQQVGDDSVTLDSIDECESADQVGILRDRIFRLTNLALPGQKLHLYLECFRRQATLLLDPRGPLATAQMVPPLTSPTSLGLIRRAVADFLFNYKMSQQYPHQFDAYDLTVSADAFNSSLTPLIDAFNRDLTAYQSLLRDQLRLRLVNEIGGKNDFLNDGIVSVRTVSGNRSTVSTTSQSYLDASSAPEVSDLANAIAGSLGGGDKDGNSGSSGGGKSKAAAGTAADAATGAATGGLSPEIKAGLAALATYQTSEVNIGRKLSVTVSPRSQVGASAADMDVRLNADESAAPTYWSVSKQNKNSPDLSRVATHDVQTHVRVDSIKLFELSSFSAVLAKGRPLFPLLPPGVELPYIGTFAGIPLKAAKEYHSSSAIVSAVVVPTATDLAFGIRFVSDRVVDNPDGACKWLYAPASAASFDIGVAFRATNYCMTRNAESLSDLGHQPIRQFHQRKLQCFATEDGSSLTGPSATANCTSLRFSDVQHQAP
jgi:hypothetical protein